jgi:hypothetical protein
VFPILVVFEDFLGVALLAVDACFLLELSQNGQKWKYLGGHGCDIIYFQAELCLNVSKSFKWGCRLKPPQLHLRLVYRTAK